jgi:phosphoribosylglycinamide formyltransferase-1
MSDSGLSIRPPRLAVLLSGGGRTLANLIARIGSGELAAEIVAVVSSNPAAGGLAVADGAGIPAMALRRNAVPDDAAYSEAIYVAISPYAPDLIVCGGFLKRLVVPSEWEGRILNIHPCLIPESNAAGSGFYGERVHQAVLASGAVISGATVHVVDNDYDHGPIVLRQDVPILPGDTAETLAARVFEAECELYPRAIIAHWHTVASGADVNPAGDNG